MENIRIHNKNYDIVLFLDKNIIFGYKFNKDNTIEKINSNVLKYFDFLICSSDFKVLPNEDDYKVVLDIETGFKHYFKGSSEDYEMFFKNNGKVVCSYQNDKQNNVLKNITKIFAIGSTSIALSLSSFLLVEIYKNNHFKNNYVSRQEIAVENKITADELTQDQLIAKVTSNDITIEDVKSLIYGSKELKQEEKELLYNEDLISDVLKTINTSNLLKYDLISSLKNINIESYFDESFQGYYDPSTPNVLFIRNYDELTPNTKDTISHEEIHLFQYHFCDYELLKEATAEIISDEYFNDSNIDTYDEQVVITKKLMEIIGPDPIWNYCFTGDFSQIENNVKPYLDDKLYAEFIICLNYDYNENDNNLAKFDKLNSILNVLYNNKYNHDIKNDEVISLLSNEQINLKRYYFNKNYINKESSYYEEDNNVNSIVMTVNQAIFNEFIFIDEEIKEYISPSEIYNYLKNNNNKGLTRNCIYADNFKETNVGYIEDGVKVSGYLNDEYIENVSEEELISKDIILDCKYYYIKDRKRLTLNDYIYKQYNEDNQLIFTPNKDKCYDVKFNDDGDMEVYLASKMYIPTIDEKFSNSQIRR